MSGPVRIQRSRAAGSRMPEGAVYVGRPTKWGNPFRPEDVGRDLALVLYRNLLTGWDPSALKGWPHEDEAAVYYAHTTWLKRLGAAGSPIDRARAELRGRDLACWCAVGSSCHADVLLEVANS